MKRYVLCLVPLLLIVAARAIWLLARRRGRVLAAVVLAASGVHLALVDAGKFNYDYDQSFRHQVLGQREVTRWLEEHVGAGAAIHARFPVAVALEDPRYGYVRQRFTRVTPVFVPGVEYVVAAEVDSPFPLPEAKMQLVRTFASPYMTARIYRVTR